MGLVRLGLLLEACLAPFPAANSLSPRPHLEPMHRGGGRPPPRGGGGDGCSPAIYVNKVLEKGV